MIKGIGTDIISIDRIKKTCNEQFIKRILHEDEINLLNQINNEKAKFQFIAGRFAGKEAYAKALGTGIGEVSFKEINIKRNELGAPYIENQSFKVHISISHCEEYATSTVIIEC